MNKVHISQFYPCSKVLYAAELYYICELGKYLYLNYEQQLSLDGVLLSEDLKSSEIWEYFRIVVSNDWICEESVGSDDVVIDLVHPIDFNINITNNYFIEGDDLLFVSADEKMKIDNSPEYAIRTPTKLSISFKRKDADIWFWDLNGLNSSEFTKNNRSIRTGSTNQNLISLIAYVAVNRVMTGEPDKFAMEFDFSIAQDYSALAYISILAEHSNCFAGWFFYKYSDNVLDEAKREIGYFAWYRLGQDQGKLNRFYTAKEKLHRMKELDIKEGDFVMFYERFPMQRNNIVKGIKGCKLAIINEIKRNNISLTYFNTTRPYFHQKYEFDNNTTIVKELYSFQKPYENIRCSRMNLDINDVGVEYYLYDELYFITPLEMSDDEIPILVSDGTRVDNIRLDQNNLIYWIMMDYNYEFNQERFLKKYFKNEEPLYDIYMRGEELDPSYYINEN